MKIAALFISTGIRWILTITLLVILGFDLGWVLGIVLLLLAINAEVISHQLRSARRELRDLRLVIKQRPLGFGQAVTNEFAREGAFGAQAQEAVMKQDSW